MRKITYIIVICLLINSCQFPSNVFVNQTQTTGLDLSKGKWILNEIDCPNNYKSDLVEKANKEFSLFLSERYSYAPITKGLLLPKKTDINPSVNQLKDLKKGTGCDYFINIQGKVLQNDLEDLNGVFAKYEKVKKTITEVTLEVYDLNLLQTVYSQKVISKLQIPNNQDDFYLINKNKNLLLNGLNKLLKDVKQKSIRAN